MADLQDLSGGAALSFDRAIFTSLPSPTGEGYRLVAWSSGVRPEERAELTRRGPSHGSLSASGPDAGGLLLLRMQAGGRAGFGLVRAAGTEHTQRGGARVWTDFLLADPAALARAGLHPAQARVALEASPPVRKPVSSAPLPTLAVAAEPCCPEALRDAAASATAATIASMLVDAKPRVIATGGDSSSIFEAALHLVPAALRADLQACGGLRFSQSRGVRVTVTDRIEQDTIRATRGHGIECVDLSSNVPAPVGALAPWFAKMARLCAEGRAAEAVAAAAGMNGVVSTEDVLRAAAS